MGRLNRPQQVESLPDVNVAVERPRVSEVIFGRHHAEDGLQVAYLPENPPLGSESVATQRPELQTATRTFI